MKRGEEFNRMSVVPSVDVEIHRKKSQEGLLSGEDILGSKDGPGAAAGKAKNKTLDLEKRVSRA